MRKIGFTVLLVFLSFFLLDGCGDVFNSGYDYDSEITAVRFSASTMNVKMRESEYLRLTLNPSKNQGRCGVSWEFDPDLVTVVADNFGAVITGVKAGHTFIKASCNGIIATCMVSVISDGSEGLENPYILSNFNVIEMMPGERTTISSSLYGGSVEDMELFTWEVRNSDVVSIYGARNNCIIEGLKPGSTQVICRHPDAKYPYSFIVFVGKDLMNQTYITTSQNILTIDKNTERNKMVSVDLVNPVGAAYNYDFSWNYADEDSKGVISISPQYQDCSITPLKNGIARLIVSHKNAEYDLEITVRVITIVENTYIEIIDADEGGKPLSSLIIDGSDRTYRLSAGIKNYDKYVDPSTFEWSVPDGMEQCADITYSGNIFTITGKKNGVFKVSVRNELCEYPKTFLVILQRQIGSAIDSSVYITTSQNYVQLKAGDGGYDSVTIDVMLIGGVPGVDDMPGNSFTWWIPDGRSNKFVDVGITTANSEVKDSEKRSVRAAADSGNVVSASMDISVRAGADELSGEFSIMVSHPKSLYETEIKVRVYPKSALLNPMTLVLSESVIRHVNTQPYTGDFNATVRNPVTGNEDIEWSSSDNSVVRTSVGSTKSGEQPGLQFTAGTGSKQTRITARLDGSLSDKSVLVLSANTKEDLDKMKYIYSDISYIRIAKGEKKELSLECFNLAEGDRVSWTTDAGGELTVSPVASSKNFRTAELTANEAFGEERKFTVTATLMSGPDAADCLPAVFNVTLVKDGESSEIFDENAGYLTTNQNAVVIENVNDSMQVEVSGVRIDPKDMRLYTKWTMMDMREADDATPVFQLMGDSGDGTEDSPVIGDSVLLTALKPGKSVLTVKNKKSENSISINAKCGELYEWTDEYVKYVVCTPDIMNIVNGSSSKLLSASLHNSSAPGGIEGVFSFKVSRGDDIVEIQSSDGRAGTCYVLPKNPGQAIITVTNTLAVVDGIPIETEVLVNVANSEAELNSFRYLTTDQNVVTVSQGGHRQVDVSLMNFDGVPTNNFMWHSEDSNIVEVNGSNASFASLTGKNIGSTRIFVGHTQTDHELAIIVNVVDPVAASIDPYISCPNIVNVTVGGPVSNLMAELVGGNDADNMAFTWAVADTSVASIYQSNNTCEVRAVREGVTQIVVSHPRASIDRTVLVISEPKPSSDCYISLSTRVLKLSPTDGETVVTAELVGGTGGDAYGFKWWADSYEKIDMDYSQGTCVIKPIRSGKVTLYCSHPKAKGDVSVIVNIGKFLEFNFSRTSVEVKTGTPVFVNMEIPSGLEDDVVVAYSSSDNSLCTVSGNLSVCTLRPGSLPDGKDSDYCTVYAQLLSRAGQPLSSKVELAVQVTKKDKAEPYIVLHPDTLSTVIELNKGDRNFTLNAAIKGNNADSLSLNGLTWSEYNENGKFIDFVGGKNIGANVQINAIEAGMTTLTIEHRDVKNPLTVYIIVKGFSEPTVQLPYGEGLDLFIGEETHTVTATVVNDAGEELVWTVVNDVDPNVEQDFFNFTSKKDKCYLYPLKVGEATITCSIASGSSKSIKVRVHESNKLDFFVYDDEGNYDVDGEGNIVDDRRHRNYVNFIKMVPGEHKVVHWESMPVDSKVFFTVNDNSILTFDKVIEPGYYKEWTNPIDRKTYRYPEGVGTTVLVGGQREETAVLGLQRNEDSKNDSITVMNGYGFMLALNKNQVHVTPDELAANLGLIYVDYEVCPADSEIWVAVKDKVDYARNLQMAVKGTAVRKEGNGLWKVLPSQHTSVDRANNIARGTLQFYTGSSLNDLNVGEINAVLKVYGHYDDKYNRTPDFKETELKLQVFYPDYKFNVSLTRSGASVSKSGLKGYSFYRNGMVYLGDGEYISGDVNVDMGYTPRATLELTAVEFEQVPSNSKIDDGYGMKQYQRVQGNSVGQSAGRVNWHPWFLTHTLDYGYINSSGVKRMYRITEGSPQGNAFVDNETVLEQCIVGYLVIKYKSFESQNEVAARIPVSVTVRNCPALKPQYRGSDYVGMPVS